MKTKILIFISLIIVLFLVGCNTTNNQNNSNIDQKSIDTSSNVNSQNNLVIVSIKNFQFNPTSITIKSGEKIRFVNEDSATHTIKSNEFNSDVIATGKDFEFTFSKPGTYDYICGLHPSMKGRIIVE